MVGENVVMHMPQQKQIKRRCSDADTALLTSQKKNIRQFLLRARHKEEAMASGGC